MFAYYYSLIPVYSFISYAHTLYACALFLLFYTLTGSLSDDPEFACQDIGCFYFIDQVFEEAGLVARSWSFSLPILILLSFFLISVDSVVCADSLYIAISRYSFSVFI